MAEPMKLPAPNLQGNYEGACVVCLHGTDTGLALAGEPEFVIAGLVRLGVPMEQAAMMLSDFTGCEAGMVPAGDVEVPLRICDGCARKAAIGVTVGLVSAGVPMYSQRAS